MKLSHLGDEHILAGSTDEELYEDLVNASKSDLPEGTLFVKVSVTLLKTLVDAQRALIGKNVI